MYNIKCNLLDPIFSPYDFQTPATPIAEGIIRFHHDIMVLLTFVCFFILWMLLRVLYLYYYPEKKSLILTRSVYSFSFYKHQGVFLEIIWTMIPALILMLVAIPSFALLYSTSTFCNPELTLKIIGHQWYWSYEITDIAENSDLLFKEISFDSYLKKVELNDLVQKKVRLLFTDKEIVVPTEVYIRLLITSDDVLHSWAVPAFGIKVDACPGRLNSINMIIDREGTFWGACSEICGVNHAFMPIGVKATTALNYFIYRLSC